MTAKKKPVRKTREEAPVVTYRCSKCGRTQQQKTWFYEDQKRCACSAGVIKVSVVLPNGELLR